jgi:hypothetical protein
MVRRMDYRPIGMRDARPSWATPVMLVASSEDHLLQLVQIRDQWRRSAHVWVTFNEPDARSLQKARLRAHCRAGQARLARGRVLPAGSMGCGDGTQRICKLRTMTADADDWKAEVALSTSTCGTAATARMSRSTTIRGCRGSALSCGRCGTTSGWILRTLPTVLRGGAG